MKLLVVTAVAIEVIEGNISGAIHKHKGKQNDTYSPLTYSQQ